MAYFDLSEVRDLARDMVEVGRHVRTETRDVINDSADRITRQWRRNARETGEAYAKWYVLSIGHGAPRWADNRWTVVIEPDTSMPQGNMSTGFEYGSINQSYPHLDAHRAVDSEEKHFADMVEREGEQLLWELIR